jgi:TonB family protein
MAMPQKQETRGRAFRRGFLGRGALLSLLIHVNGLSIVGMVIWTLAEKEIAQRPDEVDVAFEDMSAADLPKDLPPLDAPTPDSLDVPPPPKQDKRKQLVAQAAEKQKQPDKPEPEIVVPPLPPMPEPPPPPPEKRSGHEKMVDLETDKDVEPPPDAKFLAEKNSRADEETRARDTNLEKAQKGDAPASSPSDRDDTSPGSDKAKIAELEDVKSALGRKAPDVTPHVQPEQVQAERRPENKSPLALRDPAPRSHELTPETADPSLPRAADGDLARPDRNVRGPKTDPTAAANGKRIKLALSGEDYEYLFGAEAEAERHLAQKQRSSKLGRGDQKRARVLAALENFIPEIREGNVTSLNARAAPFAAFIARMHRNIHKLWGFGALEDWDDLPGSSPFNNPNLLTTLDIVLERDGTVGKVTMVRSSGYLPYDAAAIDTVYSAGPYPDPPRGMRSPNGKIYIRWRFYRDDRQCATSGVDHAILDNAPAGGDHPDGDGHDHDHEHGSATAAPPAPAGVNGGGPRRLQRLDRGKHHAGMERLDQEVAVAEEAAGENHGSAPAPAAAASRATDPAARTVAERWFGALAAGRARAMVETVVLPFRTGGKEVSRRDALEAMLSDLSRETRSAGAGASRLEIHTTASLRAAIGKLPPNVDDGTGEQLYALATSGGHDVLILILAQRGGHWRPVGLVRR